MGEVEVEQLLKKMAVADASGLLNTGKWGTGTFAALGEPVPIFRENNGRR